MWLPSWTMHVTFHILNPNPGARTPPFALRSINSIKFNQRRTQIDKFGTG